ncbi:MAG: hypothetical protein NTX96_00765 [Candidatus Zambryskibacteria bacterium]|nr:hypothetical protein [Candidatus Zambryskibacteria bacterium]
MKVALYSHHHCLPFWHSPSQPDIMFDPETMADWKMEIVCDAALPGQTRLREISIKEIWAWPLLLGLVSIDLPIMAHVSIRFNDGKVEFPKRVWVQITTLPETTGADGLPVVVDGNGDVQVKLLWGRDNGTYSPNELLDVSNEKRMIPDTWHHFFHTKLWTAKQSATKLLVKMVEETKVYDVIK